ncbi:radical SAM family heme chaperone HemW [Mobiluncus porci]|uniref:radical SAM family heme chaperone HemW n=1 Tax=Mobiluncus porci TaxID=2652278 RepID=UPI001E2DB14B|nr:radical SAM family heme chaperone HemW [Mobiluncus porci]
MSAYVHVPYCLQRCGYCDFNTYANLSLGPGVDGYADALTQEIKMSHGDVLFDSFFAKRMSQKARPHDSLSTVFFGGGTPTILPASDLVKILEALRATYGIVDGAEVTAEANPDTVDAGYLEELARGGFTRVSFGMQSAAPHVLATLDRTHTQAHLEAAVRAAHNLGLETSVDLIYGTPGESLDDWRASLEAALNLGVKHISCYALTIEPGTRLGLALARGEIAPVDPDDQADKYEIADAVLSAAGLQWYEISNWAVPGRECRHNLAYWRNRDWLGFGPGAHSHLRAATSRSDSSAAPVPLGSVSDSAGVRWWNVKSPVKWLAAVSKGELPVEDSEVIKGEAAWLEHVLLNIRLREGLDLREPATQSGDGSTLFRSLSSLPKAVTVPDCSANLRKAAEALAGEGLLDADALTSNRGVLTLKGRLLADTVTRRLSEFD